MAPHQEAPLLLAMKSFSKKNLYRFLILLTCGGVLILLYIFLTSFIENKIATKIVSLNGKAASVSVNLFSRTLNIENLELFPKDGTPYGLNLNKISITGLNLYQLLKNNEIRILEVNVTDGRFLYDKTLKAEEKKSNDSEIQKLFIQSIQFTNILSEIRTDTVINFSSILNFHVTGMSVEFDSTKKAVYSAEVFDGDLKKINISRNAGMYGMSVAGIHFSSEEKKIIIDSTLLIPNYSKYDFAHRKGEQVARVNLSVPKIVVEGISLEGMMDSLFTATKVEITSLDLHVFKDKRVPFLRNYNIPLPMESFLELPYSITVDSLVIKDSQVTIEEMAETGTKTGFVTFEHINAFSARFSNRNSKTDPPYTVLYAKGLMMGSGQIDAAFSFPLNGSLIYYTKGSISEMPFEKLNPVLENIARFRIESGKLNSLKFDFQYTDLESNGTMEIDYVDLQITGLKKDYETSGIKTILANTFVKNEKSKSLSKLKRTGSIHVERDRRRYIFNIWWRSILSGLKSTILGIEDKKNNKK